jgi:D-sedoheptulose 7-phosphate isomerase
MKTDPNSYFRKLSDLLCSVSITDSDRNVLDHEKAYKQVVSTMFRKNVKVLLIGNGGSAAIVNHMCNDLCFSVGCPAMIFNEPSQLTAISNDYGYECVFEKPIALWAKENDLLVAVSSSGKSKNILRGVQAALEKGCKVVTFSGFSPDNPLRQLGNINFYISSSHYGEVETTHMTLTHYLTDLAMSRKPTSAIQQDWRKTQNIPAGTPSTIYNDPVSVEK